MADTRSDAMTKREELARVVIPKMDCAQRLDPEGHCTAYYPQGCGCAQDIVDAILDALMKPGERARKAGETAWMSRDLNDPESEPVRDAYRAILTHIKEGRDDRP